MRVLYLVFNEGYSGDVDLAAEAIRLTRQLAALVDEPEVHGLLALMLLHHARRVSRTGPDGSIVALADQDRGRWDADLIAEGIVIAQAALARDRLGEYQAQAAIAALHADARSIEETDWAQIVEWYDELLRFADTPIVRLNRAVAVGEADGRAGGVGGAGRGRRARPPAGGGRRPPPREERRARARGPPLRQRSPQRPQPRRARPPDPPGRRASTSSCELASHSPSRKRQRGWPAGSRTMRMRVGSRSGGCHGASAPPAATATATGGLEVVDQDLEVQHLRPARPRPRATRGARSPASAWTLSVDAHPQDPAAGPSPARAPPAPCRAAARRTGRPARARRSRW